MIKFLVRAFIKITGFIPFWLILKPKFYYSSYKAKKESKNLKGGAIIVSNHTRVFDYYVFVFRHLFHVVHTMVADVVYKFFFLPTLNKIMGNIKVNTRDPSNFEAITNAKKILLKKKTLLVFPEGRLEDKKGELIEFKASAIVLAYQTNTPIIPYYVDGKYGIFSRPHFIAGEKIYLHQIFKKDSLTDADVREMVTYVKNVILGLKHQLQLMRKYETQDLITKSCWVMDSAKLISPPWRLVFWSKKKYLGNKKEIKRLLKDKAIIASNHIGIFDPISMVLAFFSRRIRIVAQEDLYKKSFVRFAMNNAGVIKYRRNNMNNFDIKLVLTMKEILEARGVVGIYPQGHIIYNEEFTKPLKGGLAMISLLSNTPIIPLLMSSRYRAFHLTRFAIGGPIYPDKFLNGRTNINNQVVEQYNEYIYNHMKCIYDTIRQKG